MILYGWWENRSMLILSIDTSTLNSSVSVSDDTKTLAETNFSSKEVLSEKLLFIINELLKSSALKIEQIKLIAAALGPGSFTGLRVGISTVKGLAYPLNIPVVGYSTLNAFAYNLRKSNLLIVPMLDARKGEVYTAAYKFDKDSLIEVKKKTVSNPLEFIKGINEKSVFLGEGAVIYRSAIEDFLKEEAVFGTKEENCPKSSNGALLALNKFKSSGQDDIRKLEPFYLRRSEAEIKFNKIKESNIDNLKQMFYKT